MTLFIHVFDRVKVKDVVRRIVHFIVRVVKQVVSAVIKFTKQIAFQIRGTRAPPGELLFRRVLKKAKGARK